MRILATQYTLPRKALEIYLSGCSGDNGKHCPHCQNPESWSFNQGDMYNNEYFNKLKEKIESFDNLIQNIEIYGGEPNDQNKDELLHFLMDLKTFNRPIWLFTRYDLKDCPKFEYILCDYIKCGKYLEELSTTDNLQYGFKLATKNQKIFKKNIDF